MSKEKDKDKSTKTKPSDIILRIIIIAVAVALAVTLCWKFYGIINGSKSTTKDTAQTEVEKLMNRNLDTKYPSTPTAVVDVYCSITKALHSSYKTELPEEQVTKLCNQLRALMDDELLENNDYDKHLSDLNKELEQYRKDKMLISRYTVQELKELKTYEQEDGRDYTRVQITYSMKKGSSWFKQNEQVILRKDEEGRWKILGNEVSSVTDDEDEE